MTDFEALDALWPLAPDDLFRQWVLTRDPGGVPSSWRQFGHDGWILGAHPDGNVCVLRASDGTSIGWIIEPLVQLGPHGARLAEGDVVLSVPSDPTAVEVEAALYGRDQGGRSSGDGIEGPWVAVVLGAGRPGEALRRLYLGATHSIVFDHEHRVVATTHNLVPDVRRDLDLSRSFDSLATKSYFSFGLTPFEGVKRLLPNHYLDLDSFEAVRHWPVQPLAPLPDGPNGAEAIVEHCRRMLSGVAEDRLGFRIFLSAGKDSRAMLSLMRPFVEEGADVVLETSVGRDLWSQLDGRVAGQLAQIAELPHTVTKRKPLVRHEEGVMRTFVRIGEARSGKNLADPPLRSRLALEQESRFAVGGMAGEAGRAFYWQRSCPDVLSPELLAERTRSPAIAAVLAEADDWLGSVPDWMTVPAILDLAYIEQRLGCWESPSRYRLPGRLRSSSPMASAYNLETMLRLPEDYRVDGLLQQDMVRFGWPELLTLPFNTPTGWLRVRRDADVLRRKLRRRVLRR